MLATENQVSQNIIGCEVYQPTNALAFILTDTKTLVCTNTSTFLIRYDHRNYIKRLERLREMIRNWEVRSIIDLVAYCDLKPGGYHDQMSGLEMVPTVLDRHL